MIYPTIEEVENADLYQLCRWNRFLPSPSSPHEIDVLQRISERMKDLGGITPAISKHIGWD